VFAAFWPTLVRLPRDVFEVSLIAVEDPRARFNHSFLDEQARVDTVVRVGREDGWIHSARRDIAKLDVDLLVFLDHSMTDRIHKLALSRLAPVQAATYGHPVSTGLPRSIQDYYISWESVELPLPQSQEFYSEELVLLPGNVMDSYVEPRTRDGVSLETRQRFSQFTRQGFVDAVNNILPHSAINARWYTCMHTAYKRHPAFDAILLQIQERDPSAHIILLQEPTEHQQIVVRRFENIRADLSRIHFLPLLTHHFLMALYSLTDVVLDSVFHGGGTTSREVLEVGGPIVTLPMHVCGSRPTLAYYKLMGGFDELVANSPAECALLLCRCMALAPCRDLGAGPMAFDVLLLWAGTLRSLCESRCRVPSTSSGFELASRMPRAFCFGIRARFVRGRICCSA
jgi:predicted O-linked N-acetylglucosamine transferase (SPINDLY family)